MKKILLILLFLFSVVSIVDAATISSRKVFNDDGTTLTLASPRNMNLSGTLTLANDLTARNVYTSDGFLLDCPLETFLTMTSNQVANLSANSNIAWAAAPLFNEIPYSATTYELSLSGGVTYSLEACLYFHIRSTAGSIVIGWWDYTNSTWISQGILGVSLPIAATSNTNAQPFSKAVFTPAANCDVGLRIQSSNQLDVIYSVGSYAEVRTLRRKR